MKYIDNWFSNGKRLSRPIVYQRIEFWTVENFYQAMKVDKRDITTRRRIAALPPFGPNGAKREGRKLQLRPDWETIKEAVMEYALRQKFRPGTPEAYQLLDTIPVGCPPRQWPPIVETNNWHDNEWGNCICPRCAGIEGQDKLGKLLMDIRSDLFDAIPF